MVVTRQTGCRPDPVRERERERVSERGVAGSAAV